MHHTKPPDYSASDHGIRVIKKRTETVIDVSWRALLIFAAIFVFAFIVIAGLLYLGVDISPITTLLR